MLPSSKFRQYNSSAIYHKIQKIIFKYKNKIIRNNLIKIKKMRKTKLILK